MRIAISFTEVFLADMHKQGVILASILLAIGFQVSGLWHTFPILTGFSALLFKILRAWIITILTVSISSDQAW